MPFKPTSPQEYERTPFDVRRHENGIWERILRYEWKVAGRGWENTGHSIFQDFEYEGKKWCLGVMIVYYDNWMLHPRNTIEHLVEWFKRCVDAGTVEYHFYMWASDNPYPRNDKWYEDDSLFPEMANG